MSKDHSTQTVDELLLEIDELRARLTESEEALYAIRNGEVDAIIVSGQEGEKVFSLMSSETPYRILLEEMEEGVVTVKSDGTILYCNKRFSALISEPLEKVVGSKIQNFVMQSDKAKFSKLMKYGLKRTENGMISFFNNVNKSPVYLKLSIQPLPLGNLGDIGIVASDVTQMQQYQHHLEHLVIERTRHIEKVNETLKKNQYLLNAVMVATSDPIYIKDTQSRILLCNPALEMITGKSSSEIFGKTDTEYYNDSYIGKILHENDLSVIESGQSQIFEETINTAIGTRTFLSSKAPFINDSGDIIGIIGISHDITERKHVEEALRNSEEKFSRAFRNSPNAITITRLSDGKIIEGNESVYTLLGYTHSEVVGKTTQELGFWAIPAERLKLTQTLASKGFVQNEEIVLRKKDGTIIPVDLSASLIKIDNQQCFLSSFLDLTERKKSEEALLLSEERFRTIAESLPVMILINHIRESVITYVNEPYERAFGFTKGELIGDKIHDLFYFPHDRIKMITELRKSGEIFNREVMVKKSDGTSFWVLTSIRKIVFMNEPSYLTASIDITETKKVQDELIRLNRTLDAHNKSSQAMMRSKNEFDYLNEVCRIIIEYCGHYMVWVGYAEDNHNKRVKPVAYSGFDKGYIDQLDITWDESERGFGPTGTAIRTGKPSLCRNMQTDPAFEPWREAAISRGFASSLVLPLISEGKTFGSLSIYSTEPDPFSENEIDLLTELTNDLAYGISYLRLEESERASVKVIKENEVKLKELLATKDKFFNIVAHDLKNPFTSLIGSSELLYENIDNLTPESIKRLASILNDASRSGLSILQNLLDWSRSQTGLLKISLDKINLRVLIAENISNLQLSANNKEISIINESEENIYVISDRNMINTVIRNLLSNAIKFTHKGGRVAVSVNKEPDNITIVVKDNGVGISQDMIGKLFNLETKNWMPGTENEQGTGLGLKLSKEFVEKLNGRIWVKSSENQGSEFKFSIPACTTG